MLVQSDWETFSLRFLVLFVRHGVWNETKSSIAPSWPLFLQKVTLCKVGHEILSWENGRFEVFFDTYRPKKQISSLPVIGKPSIFWKYNIYAMLLKQVSVIFLKWEEMKILSERCRLTVTKALKCNLQCVTAQKIWWLG